MKVRLLLGLCATLVLFSLLPLATAHGELVSTRPAAGTVLEAPPESATLTFSEPVEVPFSVFKVYPLGADMPEGEPSEREWQRLNGLAGALVAEVLMNSDDEGSRADSGVITGERRSTEIEVGLQDGLNPGAYVLMWRVLAIDTHITQGFVTFVVASEE